MCPKLTLDQPGMYLIRVQGKLSQEWFDFFEEMSIHTECGAGGSPVTTLTGCLPDQAAVQGVLQKLYNLGFPLLSAEKIEPPEQVSM